MCQHLRLFMAQTQRLICVCEGHFFKPHSGTAVLTHAPHGNAVMHAALVALAQTQMHRGCVVI